MITLDHCRGNFWLRLKLLLTLGHMTMPTRPAGNTQTKPKHRSHRTTAFFEMP